MCRGLYFGCPDFDRSGGGGGRTDLTLGNTRLVKREAPIQADYLKPPQNIYEKRLAHLGARGLAKWARWQRAGLTMTTEEQSTVGVAPRATKEPIMNAAGPWASHAWFPTNL